MKTEMTEQLNKLSPQKRALFILTLRNRNRTKKKSNVLVKQKRSNTIPLSPVQESIWMWEELNKDSLRFLLPAYMEIKGRLDLGGVKKAVNKIIARHEALRTYIQCHDNIPMQHIAPELEYEPVICDIRNLQTGEKEDYFNQLFSRETNQKFELHKLPLLRIHIVIMEDTTSYFILNLHHIISDEISFEIFRNEFIDYYTAFANNDIPWEEELPIQFADYSIWKKEWLHSDDYTSQLSYWQKQLEGDLKIIPLPLKTSIPNIKNEDARYCDIPLTGDTISALRTMHQEENVTLFMLFLAMFSVLLYRVSGYEDIIVSTPISGRKWGETENLIGVFVNMILLRLTVSGSMSFKELLVTTRKIVTEAFSYQDIPAHYLLKTIKQNRETGNLTSHVCFNYISSSQKSIKVNTHTFGPFEYAKARISHNLGIFIDDRGNTLVAAFSYKVDAFEDKTVKDMADKFSRLINEILKDREQSIIKIPLSAKEENEKADRYSIEIDSNDQFDF